MGDGLRVLDGCHVRVFDPQGRLVQNWPNATAGLVLPSRSVDGKPYRFRRLHPTARCKSFAFSNLSIPAEVRFMHPKTFAYCERFKWHVPYACLLVLVVASSAPVWSQSDELAVQTWNEILLEAIRNDLARPNVHARNLHHFSTGQYALQLLTEGLDGTAVDGTVAWPDAPDGIGTWSPGTNGHRDMMAALRLPLHFPTIRRFAGLERNLGILVSAFISTTGTIPNNLLADQFRSGGLWQ